MLASDCGFSRACAPGYVLPLDRTRSFDFQSKSRLPWFGSSVSHLCLQIETNQQAGCIGTNRCSWARCSAPSGCRDRWCNTTALRCHRQGCGKSWTQGRPKDAFVASYCEETQLSEGFTEGQEKRARWKIKHGISMQGYRLGPVGGLGRPSLADFPGSGSRLCPSVIRSYSIDALQEVNWPRRRKENSVSSACLITLQHSPL